MEVEVPYVDSCIARHVVPLKSEFIKPSEAPEQILNQSDDESAPVRTESEPVTKKQKVRGQIKDRRNINKQNMSDFIHNISIDGKKPCKGYFSKNQCPFEDCKFSHDIKKFLELRSQNYQEDTSTTRQCPFFENGQTCPYGWLCVFYKSHLSDSDEMIVLSDIVEPSKDLGLNPELRSQLRQKRYPFDICPKVIKEFELYKKSRSTDSVSNDDNIALSGTVFDNDEKRYSKSYPRSLLFNDKLYLAPLTTVGNLPFRRICKFLGADITCGEMATCRNILDGSASEWALLKRHDSEDFFGVQICGNSVEELSKTCELINERCLVDFIDLNVGCPIDLVCRNGMGAGMLQKPSKVTDCLRAMVATSKVPVTMKCRTGYSDNKRITANLIPRLANCGITALTVHGRTRQQRYSKLADYEYLKECALECQKSDLPFFGNGDIYGQREYWEKMANLGSSSGIMIARGALIKPWIFTEIKERRDWDISSKERLEILEKYSKFGLEHWGSDEMGVEHTRRFLLEWLSFLYRYVPLGLVETLPSGAYMQMNWRPPAFVGRNDLETLMGSGKVSDWIKISEMLLGPARKGFEFVPKHKANAYQG